MPPARAGISDRTLASLGELRPFSEGQGAAGEPAQAMASPKPVAEKKVYKARAFHLPCGERSPGRELTFVEIADRENVPDRADRTGVSNVRRHYSRAGR